MEATTKRTEVNGAGHGDGGVPKEGVLGEKSVVPSSGGTKKVRGSDARVVETAKTRDGRGVEAPRRTVKKAWRCHKEFDKITNSNEGLNGLTRKKKEWVNKMITAFEVCLEDLGNQREGIDTRNEEEVESEKQRLVKIEQSIREEIDQEKDNEELSYIDLMPIWQSLIIQKKEIEKLG